MTSSHQDKHPASASQMGSGAIIQCRVRVTCGHYIEIGPGKMDLLAAIRAAGSISGAARHLGMSYRRAWLLVETMNQCFHQPLVGTVTGGRSGGGAKLTLDGERVLAGYNTMMAEIVDVAERHLQALLSASPLAHEAEMPLETGGSQGPAP